MNYINVPTGDYFGKGRARGADEYDSLRLISPELSRKEPDLYQTKWFDYRLMHHVQATRYWAWCYETAVRRFVAAAHDFTKASAAKVFSHPDILQAREATAAINARQHMDKIGCRYDWALTWLTNRFIVHGWRAYPRPNQLYGDELLMDLSDAWEDELRASLQIPTDAAFRVPGALSDQYAQWAIRHAQKRSQPGLMWMPLSRLFAEGVVSQGQACGVFSAEDIRRAVEASSNRK